MFFQKELLVTNSYHTAMITFNVQLGVWFAIIPEMFGRFKKIVLFLCIAMLPFKIPCVAEEPPIKIRKFWEILGTQ